MVFRPVLGGRSLWLRVLYLGRPPRAADGRAQELHRVQGPHARPSRRRARGGGREDQAVSGGVSSCTSCPRSSAKERVSVRCGHRGRQTRSAPSPCKGGVGVGVDRGYRPETWVTV